MRTGSADEDLVVVDLDDPEELERRGGGARRRYFEDHYAELPFGLGTVPRRVEPDPWYLRPGVVLWIALALLGLLALAGSDDRDADTRDRATPGTPPRAYPALTDRTGTDLLFTHLDVTSELDVDSGIIRTVEPEAFAARTPPPPGLVVESSPPDARGRRSLVVRGPSGPTVVAIDGTALAADAARVAWRPTRCEVCAVRVTDVTTGRTTDLGRTRGPPRAVALAPDGATGVLAFAGRDRLELRVSRPSGRVVARVDLSFGIGGTAPVLWSRDGRWLFVVDGATLLAVEGHSGDVRRVGTTLPPFEALSVR